MFVKPEISSEFSSDLDCVVRVINMSINQGITDISLVVGENSSVSVEQQSEFLDLGKGSREEIRSHISKHCVLEGQALENFGDIKVNKTSVENFVR